MASPHVRPRALAQWQSTAGLPCEDAGRWRHTLKDPGYYHRWAPGGFAVSLAMWREVL